MATPGNSLLAIVDSPALGLTSAFLTWVDAAGTAHAFYPDLVISEAWDEGATVTEHPVEQGANVVDHVRVELVKCTLTIFATNEPIGANNWDTPTIQSVSISGESTPSQGTYPQPPVTAKVWKNELALRGAALALGGAVGGAIGGTVGNAIGEAAGAALGSLLFKPHEEDTTVQIVAGIPAAATASGNVTVQQFANPQDFVAQTIQLLALLRGTAQLLTLNGSKQSIPAAVIESFSYSREESDGTGATITLGITEIRLVQTQVVTVPLPTMPKAATPVKKGAQNPSDGSNQQQQSVAEAIGSAGADVLKRIFTQGLGGGVP